MTDGLPVKAYSTEECQSQNVLFVSLFNYNKSINSKALRNSNIDLDAVLVNTQEG
jgi:hypothetical protein